MLRILFIVLAVVAVVLAIVLRLPELYIAAGIMVIIAAVVLFSQVWHRQEKTREIYAGRAQTRQEELAEVGILGIRPKTSTGQTVTIPEDAEEPREEVPAWKRPEEENPVSGDSHVVTAPARIRKKNWTTDVDEGPAEIKLKKDVIFPCLQSLLTATDANTVALLKANESLRYRIEAIISRNSYARTQGSFLTKTPLLIDDEEEGSVVIVRVGERGMIADNLGYYLEPIAVRQVGLMPLIRRGRKDRHLLLLDSMEEDGLNTERQKLLLKEYGHLLSTLLEVGIPGKGDESVSRLRPRRDIIAEEMRLAREEDRSLALALIHLNESEAIVDKGATTVTRSERELEKRLRKAMKDHGRIERFGELTFGAFYRGNVTEVEQWALALQRELAEETGDLEGGVSIGIAMLNDRHENADMLRADATDALLEAFETRACTIFE